MTVRGILCDLDGVVYRGEQACPGAVEGLSAAKKAGVQLLFMTNNASRTPSAVADHVSRLGLPTEPSEVLTASQVAAAVLASRRDRGELHVDDDRAVLAVGGEGLGVALDEVGLPWRSPSETRERVEAGGPSGVVTVVQGYGPEVGVPDLTEASYAIAAGAPWLATNDDATLPTTRGLAPGNGSLVAAVRHATGKEPEVVGKPHAPAYQVAVARLGLPVAECLMIGDRLETDIAGAANFGLLSALVLTGVSTREEAAAAPAGLRPDHVAPTIPDLAFLWAAG
ncbi:MULTISPECIES: HAD-IIA family hydrolase [unclassified Ornithinimicrobium]|uniref:HAD-IIA family hydrolase n=1 Tax=unclassified Ornithinimicrobium TaxID=2615080 RepID=UPI003851EEBD